MKAATLAQVPPGSVVEALVNGEEVAVCNVGGDVRAIGGICPHAGGPLGAGAMDGDCVVCPFHAWGFDSRTGEYDGNPKMKVKTFAVKVEGDDIFVDLKARRA